VKINEITNEGLFDKFKQVGAAVKGAVAGGGAGGWAGTKAGWQAQGAANKQQDLIKSVSTKALQSWQQVAQNLKAAGRTATPEDIQNWFTQFSGTAPTNAAPENVNPAQMNAWIQKEVGNYLANKTIGQPTAQPQPKRQPTQRKPRPAKNQQPAQNQQQNAAPEENPTAAQQPNQADEPITINGQKLDPKNPKDKAIIDKIKAQQQSANSQQSAGTRNQPPTTADKGDIFTGDTQQADAGLPDISKLTPEERAELRRQLLASMAAK